MSGVSLTSTAEYCLSCMLITDLVKTCDILWNPDVHSCVHKSFQIVSFEIQFIPFHHMSVWSSLKLSSHPLLFKGHRSLFSRSYRCWRVKQTTLPNKCRVKNERTCACACTEWASKLMSASWYEMKVSYSWPNALSCLWSPREFWKPKTPIIFYALL
jgi:hypothetical protein